mgnify:CR=1 FL=1
MSLIARHLEQNGIPTVVIGSARDIVEYTAVARFVFTDFPLGKSGKVWIDDIKYDRRSITLTGRSWEYFAINDFVKSITESTRYYDVLFKNIEAEMPRTKFVPGVPEAIQKTKKFSLEFKVKESD